MYRTEGSRWQFVLRRTLMLMKLFFPLFFFPPFFKIALCVTLSFDLACKSKGNPTPILHLAMYYGFF